MKNQSIEALKSFAISKSGMQGGEAKRNLTWSILDEIHVSHFWSTSWSSIYACYMSFRSSRSQKSNALNGARFEVEMKELQSLEADHSKLKENFARLRNQPWVAKCCPFCCKIWQPSFRFEAQEVKNPMLQMMRDSKLKWRSYNHWKPITPSWRQILHDCEINLGLRKWCPFAAKFRNPLAVEFLLKLPDICDWHFEIFCFRYLMSKSPNSPCNPPITGFLSY